MKVEKGGRTIFLSCFKCGRIVRSTDERCPRCGMKFKDSTLFECPFCAGLVWRTADWCPTCKTDLLKFSMEIAETVDSFSMDGFVGDIIQTELSEIHPEVLRVSCPSCGLMIHGDEERCPRCGTILEGCKFDCPVCGEKVDLKERSCRNCGTPLAEASSINRVQAKEKQASAGKKKPAKEKKRKKVFGRN